MKKRLTRVTLLSVSIAVIIAICLLGSTFLSAKTITSQITPQYVQHSSAITKSSGRDLAPPNATVHFDIETIKGLFDKLQNGDIVVTRGYSGVGDMVVPGYWTHSSMFDKERYTNETYFLLSASNQTDHGSMKVGYEAMEKYKFEKEIVALRLKDFKKEQAVAAFKYADQFLGYQYSIFSKKSGNDKWYCSKIIYRAWLSQGINLEPAPGRVDPYITPTDLYNSPLIYEVGRIIGDK